MICTPFPVPDLCRATDASMKRNCILRHCIDNAADSALCAAAAAALQCNVAHCDSAFSPSRWWLTAQVVPYHQCPTHCDNATVIASCSDPLAAQGSTADASLVMLLSTA
jgi:hypothetical protein